MDFLDRHPMIQLILFLGFFLYPQDLFEDPPLPFHEAPVRAQKPSALDSKKPVLKPQGLPPFDRNRFLREFQRQARKNLISCLRSAESPRREISFVARLSKDGKLKALRLLQDWPGDKSCLEDALSEMRFDHFLVGPQDDLEISWRFEF